MLAQLSQDLSVLTKLRQVELRKREELIGDLTEATQTSVDLEGVSGILRELMQLMIAREIQPIEEFISYGLKMVFPDRQLDCKIVRKESASGMSYEVKLQDELIEAELRDNFGGSVEELCSFMFQVFVIIRLEKRRFIALDEFFTGIDSRHRDNLAQLISVLCKNYGFEILLITHQEDFKLYADQVLEAYRHTEGLEIKHAK